MLKIFILRQVLGESFKYFSHAGNELHNRENLELEKIAPDSVRNYNLFKIIATSDKEPLVFRAYNHPYHSRVNISEDFCFYRIRNNAKYKGFNICSETLLKHGEEEDTGEESFAEEAPFTLNVFVFNDFFRANHYKEKISSETRDIFKIVNRIFRESGAKISVNVTGSLSIINKRPFADGGDPIYGFRRLADTIRFNPYNNKTPLANADLVILLKERKIEIKKEISEAEDEESESETQINYHGSSFWGGASSLASSYAVVSAAFTESRYFIAKKIAHEIGHSLGVRHDKEKGHLMESRTCKHCADAHRVFSQESLEAMEMFLKKHRALFEKNSQSKVNTLDGPIRDKMAARRYINSKRRHTYQDIVNKRLQGREPENASLTYYLLLSLIIYGMGVTVAALYIK
ncbi:hypothetical protein ENBRE01_1747 [Enteropsectra breve]|nr:hypothetical protein ENBRE01_1747 [Enteropsectra breve]